MVTEYKSRFGDAPWFGKNKTIILGGVGGIGSWVALSLGRIGHDLVIFDMDTYDATNIAGQFCGISSIGKKKATVSAELVAEFSGMHPNVFGKYTEKSLSSPIMIAAFDNMEARKTMFENWKKQEDRELFIDGRMTAEHFQVFGVQKGMEEEYEKHLFSDDEANALRCSFKATSHNAMGIAYIITGLVNNFLSEDPSGLREIPFETEMSIALFMFQTKSL